MTGRLDRAPRGKIGTHAAHEPTHHAPAAERIVKAPGAAGAYAREGGGRQDHPTAVPVVAVRALTESTDLAGDTPATSDLHQSGHCACLG
jgi:hypothetical protein